MTSEEIILSLVSGLVGAVIASGLSFIATMHVNRKQARYLRRYNLYVDIMRCRGSDLNGHTGADGINALNMLLAEFNDDQSIKEAVRAFFRIPLGLTKNNNEKRSAQFQQVALAVARNVLDDPSLTLEEIDRGFFPPYHTTTGAVGVTP